MISALRRLSASYPSSCCRFRAAGSSIVGHCGVQKSIIISDGRKSTSMSPFGTSTRGRGGGAAAAFELLDEDIEERFVKGSGPGGQKINKVRNCVQLTHVPTGVSVSCQDSRELHANRHIARKRLKEKVEFELKGDDSKVGRRISKIRNRKARSQRKSRQKHQGGGSTGAAAAAAAKTGQEATTTHDEERAREEVVDGCDDDIEDWGQEGADDDEVRRGGSEGSETER